MQTVLSAGRDAPALRQAGCPPLLHTRAGTDGEISTALLKLDGSGPLWDCPTMTITADSKKRVVIPWAKAGDVFACEQRDENHFSLARLNPPPPPKKMTKAQVRRAIKRQQDESPDALGRVAKTDPRTMILFDTNVILDALFEDSEFFRVGDPDDQRVSDYRWRGSERCDRGRIVCRRSPPGNGRTRPEKLGNKNFGFAGCCRQCLRFGASSLHIGAPRFGRRGFAERFPAGFFYRRARGNHEMETRHA